MEDRRQYGPIELTLGTMTTAAYLGAVATLTVVCLLFGFGCTTGASIMEQIRPRSI